MKVLRCPRALGSKKFDPMVAVKSPTLYNNVKPYFLEAPKKATKPAPPWLPPPMGRAHLHLINKLQVIIRGRGRRPSWPLSPPPWPHA
jgi:hypothetical protein